MQVLYTKDKNRRHIYKRLEKKRLILNYIKSNLNLDYTIRNIAFFKLRKISLLSSVSKIKNRCVLSNRARAVYKKFRLSRIFFKKYALRGLIMGAKKASW